MANAKVTTVEIPQLPITEERVLLELTKDEAQVLYDITLRVAGHPAQTRRALTDNVGRALRISGAVLADSLATDVQKGSWIGFM